MWWVASLFLLCLRVECSIGEAVAGMMAQTGIPVDNERTLVQDYGFRLWLGNPAVALVYSIWLGGMVGHRGLHCSFGWSADGLGRMPGDFLWRL